MDIGDHVMWNGRTYVLRGFDPMSVPDPRAYLEDLETGERVAVCAEELERTPSG